MCPFEYLLLVLLDEHAGSTIHRPGPGRRSLDDIRPRRSRKLTELRVGCGRHEHASNG